MPRWGGRNYSNRIPGALPLAGLFNPFGVYRDISPDSNNKKIKAGVPQGSPALEYVRDNLEYHLLTILHEDSAVENSGGTTLEVIRS